MFQVSNGVGEPLKHSVLVTVAGKISTALTITLGPFYYWLMQIYHWLAQTLIDQLRHYLLTYGFISRNCHIG